MKEDIEAQGKLKRARLESAKNNAQLMNTNIEELGNAEERDSSVQTKVLYATSLERETSRIYNLNVGLLFVTKAYRGVQEKKNRVV